MKAEQFDSWALVELMGHQRIAGRVTEAEIGGCKFVRVDVPEDGENQALTKYLGPSSIYAITPLAEGTARALAKRIDSAPMQAWDAERLVATRQNSALAARVTVDTWEPQDDDEEEEEV